MSTMAHKKLDPPKQHKTREVNLFKHPICFSYPSRIAMSAWIGHVPFGMYLVDVLRPRTICELGTHYGVSYCALCQAVKELHLNTRTYAVDTWVGDAQAGFYGPEVLTDLQAHHDPLYGGFSRLIQSTFDEALNYFADNTFDLLHIDGFHTYDAVKEDFDKWLPKMTDRGVVLFHDINVRERDFGVWKFWDELKLKYPSFEFVHSHGLGVLGVGRDYPEDLLALFNCSESEATTVRDFFSRLGAHLESAQELQALKPEKQSLQEQLRIRDVQVQEAFQQVSALTQQLQQREVTIHDKAARISLLDSQLEQLNQQISNNDALAQARDHQVAESLEHVALLTRQLDELTGHVSVRDLQLQEKEACIVENESRLSQLSQQVEELRHRTRELDTLLRERNVEVQTGKRQVDEKQRELQQHEQHLAQLTHELERKDLKLQSTGWQQREWEKRARAKEQELAHLLDLYRATKEDFSRSGSYRLGRALSFPLRFVKRLAVPNENGLDNQSRTNGAIRSERAVAELREEKNAHLGASLSESLSFIKEDVTTIGTETFLGTAPTLFDAEWYLLQNPDVAHAGLDPLRHYLTTGAREGRAPHPLFDPKFYLQTYPEASIFGRNPLEHYLTEGWKKGYKPNPKFDPSFYVSTYPDIAEAGVEPLTHFATEGLREGRAGCPEDIWIEPFEANFEIPRNEMAAEAVQSDIKAIAFYLPQFHPIPENDAWWGTGFTEWTNVRRGERQFRDHYQPHVPSTLDYYDLRELDVLEKQVQLAKDSGLYGFCFYYYWFAGKVLLDLPIRRMLETGKPDFPFCVCWANENWTRRWDGRENEILIAQQHSPDDDLAFLRNVQKILLHKNYITVEGKPLLIVYQPLLLPDAKATAARWREYFRSNGHGDIFLAAMQTFSDRRAPNEYGFDAGIQFPPHSVASPVTAMIEQVNPSFAGHVYDYNRTKWSFIDELRELKSSGVIYPGVMPSWDNTARRRNQSSIWVNSSPESYYDWLCQVSDFVRKNRPNEEKLVFINAWNEWAEGCHLEPDQLFGYAWLNATRLALKRDRDAN